MTDFIQHKDAALLKRHPFHNWEYANRSARLAASGFGAGDVGKVARQTDNDSYWILKATTPTWTQIILLEEGNSGQDGYFIKYTHSSRSYSLAAGAGGGGGGGSIKGVGLDGFADPGDVSNYAWINQETATATKDSDDNSIVIQTTYSGGDDWRILKKSLGSAPWTIKAGFSFYLHGRNYCSCGVILRESGSGKFIYAGPGYDDSIGWCIRAIKWTDANTYNSDIIGNQMRMPPGLNLVWIKLTNDGTDIKGYISPDGKYWVQYFSIGATAYITANEAGFGIDVNNVFGGVLKMFSFEIS